MDDRALEWQVGVWDTISEVYVREVDRRFEPVVSGLMARAGLESGQQILDIGVGTGAVTECAARAVGPGGSVTGIDISSEMLAAAHRRLDGNGLTNVALQECRAEEIEAPDGSFDAVLSSLSMMYVIDRAAAAREIARVLRPGGRFVASVWAGPEDCDIVLFQQTAGRFAGPPPVAGVGPGALADPAPFVEELAGCGLEAGSESEVFQFEFPDFDSAWETLAGVTTAHLDPADREQARKAVREAMRWSDDAPRIFNNRTHFVFGRRR